MLLHSLYEIKCQKGKNIWWKKFWLHQQTSSLVGAYVGAWGSVSSPPMGLMARTEAVLAPAVCHGLRPAVAVTQGNSTSGLDVLSTIFSRHSPAIGLNRPKTTFLPKGMIPPSSSPAACSQCPPSPALLTLQPHRERELGADGAESSPGKRRKRSFFTRSARRPVPPWDKVAGAHGWEKWALSLSSAP